MGKDSSDGSRGSDTTSVQIVKLSEVTEDQPPDNDIAHSRVQCSSTMAIRN